MRHSQCVSMISVLVLVVLVLSACQPIKPVAQGQEAASTPPAQEPAPQPHQPRPDAPPYGVRGQYAVGVRDFVIEDPERPLPVTVWYPAQQPGDAEDSITYGEHYAPLFPDMPIAGQAIRDAAPDFSGEPYPLVVFSHGNGFTRLQSVYLLEHLASHGFVVAAADHTGNNLANLGEASYPWYIYRPDDLQRVITYVDSLNAPSGALANLIDVERIAVVGHSLALRLPSGTLAHR